MSEDTNNPVHKLTTDYLQPVPLQSPLKIGQHYFAKVMGKSVLVFLSTLFSPVWQPAREQTALQPSETLLQSIGIMRNIKKKQ